MGDNAGLFALKERERSIDKERKIKIDLSKTEYPLIRNIAINEVGWKIWGKERIICIHHRSKGKRQHFLD